MAENTGIDGTNLELLLAMWAKPLEDSWPDQDRDLVPEIIVLMENWQVILPDDRREDILRNIQFEMNSLVAPWSRTNFRDCQKLIRTAGTLFYGAATIGIEESHCLSYFWDTVCSINCDEYDGRGERDRNIREAQRREATWDEILRTIEFTLRLPDALCQGAALIGLQRCPTREVRRVLDQCEGLILPEIQPGVALALAMASDREKRHRGM